MKMKFAHVLASIAVFTSIVVAQNVYQGNLTPVQPALPIYYSTPISATANVNNQVTLTIPAPAAGLYNYVCTLSFVASQNGTATANTNQVTTSTNFNSFAIKYSYPATVNGSYAQQYEWGSPAAGCVKSTSSATATTFVSPAALTNTAFSWEATYFQAP